jgi:hypothetical protein
LLAHFQWLFLPTKKLVIISIGDQLGSTIDIANETHFWRQQALKREMLTAKEFTPILYLD